jgi:putative molybdopterin biosynthesis protein
LFFTSAALDAYISGCASVAKRSAVLADEATSLAGDVPVLNEARMLQALEAFRTEGLFVIAGGDAVAGMLAQRLSEQGLQSINFGMSGYTALIELYMEGVQAAVVRLFDQKTSSYNIPYLRRLAPGMPVKVFHLYRRRIGLCVRRGNPKNITSIVKAVRSGAAFANVAKPAAARVFLDEQLASSEVKPESVVGYGTAYGSEFLAASAVAAREADVCVANLDVARRVAGVDFVALGIEQVDLVVAKNPSFEPFLESIAGMLVEPAFAKKAAHAVNGDISKMGYILYDA